MKYVKTNLVECMLLEFLCSVIVVDKSIIKKQVKLGECRVNGVKCKKDMLLPINSIVKLFVPNIYDKNIDKSDEIIKCTVYKDDNIVILDKPHGISVEQLETNAQVVYPKARLTHRLDRNTSGLIILSIGDDNYSAIVQAMNNGNICKKYIARVFGKLNGSGIFKVYIKKDSANSIVRVSKKSKNGYKEAITKYNTIDYFDGLTTVMLELVTGRTHQIRATLAHFGHFVIGDGKYGVESINRKYPYNYQQLKSIAIEFGQIDGKLNYLSGLNININEL